MAKLRAGSGDDLKERHTVLPHTLAGRGAKLGRLR